MASVRLGRYEVEDDRLPQVCMRCGAPAVVSVSKTFSWHPSWVLVLLYAGVVPYLIVAFILTKRMRVAAPLCAAHKHHWLIRKTAIGIWLLVTLLFGVMALIAREGVRQYQFLFWLLVSGLVVLVLGWIIMLLVLPETSITATEITDHSITLNGVAESFINAIEDQGGEEEEERPPTWRSAHSDQYREVGDS